MDLYHNDMAICCQKVRLVITEKHLNCALHHLDLRAGESHTPEYLKLNKRGVVPVSVAIAFRHQENRRQVASFTGRSRERALALLLPGIDASFVPEHVIFYDTVIGDIAKQLDRTPWLAGDTYSLADIAMIAYLCRLADLAQTWWWEDNPARSTIAPWLRRCKAKKGYAGISCFLNATYLTLMQQSGVAIQPKIKTILKVA
jgi:glutathione S-transferase